MEQSNLIRVAVPYLSLMMSFLAFAAVYGQMRQESISLSDRITVVERVQDRGDERERQLLQDVAAIKADVKRLVGDRQ